MKKRIGTAAILTLEVSIEKPSTNNVIHRGRGPEFLRVKRGEISGIFCYSDENLLYEGATNVFVAGDSGHCGAIRRYRSDRNDGKVRIAVGTVLMVLSITLSSAYAQIDSRADIRFGVARTILGTGDIRTTTFETEFNYKINSFFTTAISLNYGIGDDQTIGTASYVQGNTNVFISPFRNTRVFNFRLGGGLSYYLVSDITAQSTNCGPNGCFVDEYVYDRRSEFGYNVITEFAYRLNERYLVGLKLYTQPYLNGDINSGLMVKFGVKI